MPFPTFYPYFRTSMEKLKKGGILNNIPVTDASAEGKGIARIDNFVLFIDGAVSGDVVDAQIYRKKKNYAEAKVIQLIEASPDRHTPFCSHFGTCGGCKWQHLSYEKQLFLKQKHVTDALERLGKVELPAAEPILRSVENQFYRNKLEYTFSNRSWLTKEELDSGMAINRPGLGYHLPGRFDKILNIDKCYLQSDPSNEIRNEIRDFALKNDYSFWNPREQTGLLRNVMLRNTSTGEWMVVVVFHYKDEAKIEQLLKHLIHQFPQITSLQFIINPKRNDTFFDLDVHLFHGRDFILESMEGLTFSISAKSFYQTNSGQAHELYKVARTYAGLTGKENVYDLYTGTGTIALFVSSLAERVTGIDYVESAIADAKVNAERNGINNASFYAGDMKDLLTEDFMMQHGDPDVIITDPPRNGMHEDVTQRLARSKAKKIVYISCNPATQARDIQILNNNYRIERLQAVDMFPHTTHVENVALLVNRNH